MRRNAVRCDVVVFLALHCTPNYLGTWNAHRTVLQGQGLQGKTDRPVACCVNVGTGDADINDMDRHLPIGGGPG
jgi:hypothetical protein